MSKNQLPVAITWKVRVSSIMICQKKVLGAKKYGVIREDTWATAKTAREPMMLE
jgi:hypothetical protein